MRYCIISSSSKGNCTIINDYIAIDIGITFEKLNRFKKTLKCVLLTHKHKDHFNLNTLKKLIKVNPALKIISAGHLKDELEEVKENVYFIENDKLYDFKAFKLASFKLLHDVENIGYRLYLNGEKLLYATDTRSLNHIEAKDYDYYLVEANYKENEIIKKIRDKKRKGEYAYEIRTLETHLSYENCIRWLEKNNTKNGVIEFMHEHIEDEE